MNRKNTLYAGLALVVVGFIANYFGNQASYVTAEGMVVDNMLIPIGALMITVGILALLGAGVVYFFNWLKRS